MRIWRWVIICSLTFAVGAAKEPDGSKPVKVPAAPAVVAALESLAKAPELASGTLGFYMAPLDQPDKPLLTRNARQSFIPASTTKVLTTGTALATLGPDYRFQTRLYFDWLAGDAIIRGGGDPSLGRGDWDDLFKEWSAALSKAGVREIVGRVIADEGAWETQEIPDGWAWADIGNYYAPPLTPLTFHDDEFRLFFKLGTGVGEPAEFVRADPWPAGLNFISEMRTGPPGSGDNGYLYGGPGTDVYFLRGTLPADRPEFSIRGALPDAALFCAQEFTKWLMAHDIPVRGAATTSRRLAVATRRPFNAGLAPVVHTHLSPPLRELLVPILLHSLNLDCECLLRTFGAGRAQDGLAVVRNFLTSRGVPVGGYRQFDGSGLARVNMIPPETLARAMAAFVTGPNGAVFLDALPVAGESGTLSKVAANSSARGRIRAKSGTVERVKCYTGIVDAQSGKRFVFAVMVNNFDGSGHAVFGGIAALFDAMAEM